MPPKCPNPDDEHRKAKPRLAARLADSSTAMYPS
jgi:hypothetical protein